MNLVKLKKWQKVAVAICVVGMIFSIFLVIPSVRQAILEFGANARGRQLKNIKQWTNLLNGLGVEFFLFFLIAGIASCFQRFIKNALEKFSDNTSQIFSGHEKITYIVGLAVFLILNIVCIIFHEHWGDEAWAWIIAKNENLVSLFKILPNEGHPALWYLFLMPFAKMGFPYEWMSFLSLAIVFIAAVIFLKEIELPPVVKIIALFSPVFCYFSPVISRSYCFLTLELVCVAAFYSRRTKNPILWGVLLAAMLQTHIYLAALSGMFLLQMLYEFTMEKDKSIRRKILIGGIIGAVSALLLILELSGNAPSRDLFVSKLGNRFFVSLAVAIFKIAWCLIFNFSGISTGTFCMLVFILALFLKFKQNMPLKNSWQETLIFIISTISILAIFCVYAGGHWNHSVSLFTIYLLFVLILPKKTGKALGAIFSILLLFSCATTFKFIVRDIGLPFSNSKVAAECINDKCSENITVVFCDRTPSSLFAYMKKDIQIESIDVTKINDCDAENAIFVFTDSAYSGDELKLVQAIDGECIIEESEKFYLYKKRDSQ